MKKTYWLLSFCLLSFSAFGNDPFRGKVFSEKLVHSDLPALKEGECRIIVLRHGQTDWNVAGKGQGWTDIPLNETGRQEARDLCDVLENLDIKYVYTSALSRALETAQIIAKPHNAKITPDPTLRFFKQQKRPFDFLLTKSMKKRRLKKEIQTDCLAYLKDLVKKHQGETILVVTHGRVLKNIYYALEGEPEEGKIGIKNGASAFIIGNSTSLVLENL